MAKRNLVHPHVEFHNDVVTTPLLVYAEDPQRVFIRLPDRIQLGTLGQSSTLELPEHDRDLQSITNRFKVVTTVRAEFTLHNLHLLAGATEVQLPPEILPSVKELLSGKHPNVLAPKETRPVVLIWRTWGLSDPSCGAVLDAHKVPWALSVSKPTLFHGWLNHETFGARNGKIEWGAWIPPQVANIMYLRGPEGRLAMPGEGKLDTLAEAFHTLWDSKLPGQGKAAREVVPKARPEPPQSRHAKRLLAHICKLNEMYWRLHGSNLPEHNVKAEHCRSLQDFAWDRSSRDAEQWHYDEWHKLLGEHLAKGAKEALVSCLDESAGNAAPSAMRSKV